MLTKTLGMELEPDLEGLPRFGTGPADTSSCSALGLSPLDAVYGRRQHRRADGSAA